MAGRTWWLAALAAALAVPATAAGQDTVPPTTSTVRAVLFYSPSCPHCQEVISQGLPPILDRYGDQLRIAGVNTATEGGEQLYRAAIQELGIPRERVGVPTLLVGSHVLVGSFEIPDRLPEIVDEALAADGIDWPRVSLIRQALRAQGLAADATPAPEPDPAAPADRTSDAPAPESEPAAEAAPEPEPGSPPDPQPDPEDDPAPTPDGGGPERVAAPEREAAGTPGPAAGADAGDRVEAAPPEGGDTAADSLLAGAIDADARAAMAHHMSVTDRLMLDPAGNGMAIAVLILMLAALALVAGDVGLGRIRIPPPPPAAIPVLAVVGLGVAAYLAFVEVTGTAAVCGPVGDCNTVQQSAYARLLGVPVGVLGVLGYGAMLVAWAVGRGGPERWRGAARQAVWVLALVATGFSVYLTFLEPFVIGASCAWCLTSAVVTTLILLAATPERKGVGVSPTPRPSVSH